MNPSYTCQGCTLEECVVCVRVAPPNPLCVCVGGWSVHMLVVVGGSVCVCTHVHTCVGSEVASLEMWLGLFFLPVVGCQVPGVAPVAVLVNSCVEGRWLS